MKNIIFLACTLALLTACQENTNNPENTITESPTTETTTDLNSNTVETVDTEELPPPHTEEDIPSSEEALLSKLYREAISQVLQAEDFQSHPILTSTEDEFGEIALGLFQFDPNTAEAFALSISEMMVQAYGIAVVYPKEGQEEAVRESLQYFINTQIQNFTSYLPEQLGVAQSARMETLEDGTILMVMCQEQDHIFDMIAENIRNLQE